MDKRILAYLLTLLPVGESKAMNSEMFAEKIGIRTHYTRVGNGISVRVDNPDKERLVNQWLEKARDIGIPFIQDKHGIYILQSEEELQSKLRAIGNEIAKDERLKLQLEAIREAGWWGESDG